MDNDPLNAWAFQRNLNPLASRLPWVVDLEGIRQIERQDLPSDWRADLFANAIPRTRRPTVPAYRENLAIWLTLPGAWCHSNDQEVLP